MFGVNWERQETEFNEDIRQDIKTSCRVRTRESHLDHRNTLVKQGELFKLTERERGDVVWKSYIYDMKKWVLKFCLNSITNTLPTGDNLLMWGKATNDKCKQCKGRETTCHVLNNCPVSLEQGRYTWRHNYVIHCSLSCLDTDKFSVFSDLPGHITPNGGSVPIEICVTPLKPDITILDKRNKLFNMPSGRKPAEN